MTKMNGLSKKVLSLVTVICMLGAFVTVPASAEVLDGAADLLYFNDFSSVDGLSFADSTEKWTSGKIVADAEAGHANVYKHYMTGTLGRVPLMTTSIPMPSTISGKKLAVSFQLKYEVADENVASLAPYVFVNMNALPDTEYMKATDDTLFHILPGDGYIVRGPAYNGTTFTRDNLKLQEWNQFDIVIDQTATPVTGILYINGQVAANLTYPEVDSVKAIEKLLVTTQTYDDTLPSSTKTFSFAPLFDNFKIYEVDENETFGFVACEIADNVLYAELGGSVLTIPSGITVKKVGTSTGTAVNAELVNGHMIKLDLSGITLDAGAEYMIEVPKGMTDMYGRSFDDVLLFNAPAGEANIYYNKFDSTDGIVANYTKYADVRAVAETITGQGNVLEAYSIAEVSNMSYIPYAWKTVELGRAISGKMSLSFDYMFHLPDDDNPGTDQIFNMDVYLANTTTDANGEKTVTYSGAPLFQFLPGSATDWIIQSKSTSGNVRWRPSRTDYAITEKYHTITVEFDKSNETALVYDNGTSLTGTAAFNLADGLKGSFDSVMFVLYANSGNTKENGGWNAGADSFTTRIDNLRVWEEAAAMDLRVVNMDNTEVLPETEIPNAVKGFKAYFDGAATPVVSLKNNTDNEVVTVNVTSNAAGTEHTIALTEFLDAGDSYTLSVGSHKYSFTTSDSGMVISGFGIYKANGEQVDEFSDVTVGETLKAKATIYNGGGKNICISYGIFGGKFMKAFDFTQYTNIVAGISGTPVEIDIPVTADLAADEISVYLWNDLNSLTPYIQCVEID